MCFKVSVRIRQNFTSSSAFLDKKLSNTGDSGKGVFVLLKYVLGTSGISVPLKILKVDQILYQIFQNPSKALRQLNIPT